MVNLLNKRATREEPGHEAELWTATDVVGTAVLDPSDHGMSRTDCSLADPVASWEKDEEEDDDDDAFLDDEDELDDDEDFDDDFFDDDDEEDVEEDFDDDE